MTEIVITHLSGRNAHRKERFAVQAGSALSLGRTADCSVRFDPELDDLVSRKHAVITIESVAPLTCTVRDLDSRNGTFVGDQRIDRPTPLASGAELGLGAGGPRLRIEFEPAEAAGTGDFRTRDAAGGYRADTATNGTADRNTRDGVGKRTVERMISEISGALSGSWRRRWLYSLVGALSVLILVAGVYGWLSWKAGSDLRDAEAKIRKTEEALIAAKLDIARKTGETSMEVADKYREAVVKINVIWRLYDKITGKQVFHKFIQGHPAYVNVNGSIMRWLVTDDDGWSNPPIVGMGSGTGFVVNGRGFVLTNKHIAAGWQTFYGLKNYENKRDNNGWLYNEGTKKIRNAHVKIKPNDDTNGGNLGDWVPGLEGCIFDNKTPKSVRCSENDNSPFDGRNDLLDVNFPGKAASVQAQLVRTLFEVDLALIKVDVPSDLPVVVVLADKQYEPKIGADITVIGFPGDSEKTIAELTTYEAGKRRQRVIEIPEPTVFGGKISNIGPSVDLAAGPYTSSTYGNFGHLYQLSASGMEGTSGGPVFDSRNKVVGIYTYVQGRNNNITFAVPIRYGHELMELQNWNNR